MSRILVIGASGFVARNLTLALLAGGHAVRCLARNLARVDDLAKAGCEIVQGDITDLSSLHRAMDSMQAVYISYYLAGVLNDPRAYGQCYDVVSDEVLTNDRMIDVAVRFEGCWTA